MRTDMELPPRRFVDEFGRESALPGQSRFRMAKKGPLYRVEEWRRWWRIGPYGWRAVTYQTSCGVISVDDTETDPLTARQRLRTLLVTEAGPASWQPVDERTFDVAPEE